MRMFKKSSSLQSIRRQHVARFQKIWWLSRKRVNCTQRRNFLASNNVWQLKKSWILPSSAIDMNWSYLFLYFLLSATENWLSNHFSRGISQNIKLIELSHTKVNRLREIFEKIFLLSPRITSHQLQSKTLDVVEVGVLLSDSVPQLRRRNKDILGSCLNPFDAVGISRILVLVQNELTKRRETWVLFRTWNSGKL